MRKAAFPAPPSERQWRQAAGRRRVHSKEGVHRRDVAGIWMADRWDESALVRQVCRHTRVRHLAELGQGLTVHRDAKGTFDP